MSGEEGGGEGQGKRKCWTKAEWSDQRKDKGKEERKYQKDKREPRGDN